jgi:tRNA(fMet)-specific endonuclease VapC
VALLIDTSVLVGLERTETTESLAGIEDESTYISAISASELLHGVERATDEGRRAKRQAFVERVLDTIPVLPFDLDAARVHARIWARLLRRGEVIGAHDLIIAATALSRDLEVLTHNTREFSRVEGLALRGVGHGGSGRGAE